MDEDDSTYLNVNKKHCDLSQEYYCVVLHQTIDITRCFIICCDTGEFITFHEEKNDTIIKKEGYKEISADHLAEKAITCIKKTVDNYFTLNHPLDRLVSFGLCTQSNMTVVWSKSSGQPLYAALCEDDIRCDDTCQKLIQSSWRKSITIHHLCGLPISARWAGVKLKWLMDNIGTVQEAHKVGDLNFGTLDSWLLWRLTGGACYATDVTNASYTMLMNLHRVCWDSVICKFLDIDPEILPEIRSCAELYGRISAESGCGLAGLPITGVVCDIKASVIGHQGTQAGSVNLHIDPASCSSRLSIVVGDEPVFYRTMLKGVGSLISTVGFQLGQKESVVYALEAPIYNSDNLLPWLRSGARLLGPADDLDSVANSVPDSGGLFFLPSGTSPPCSRLASLVGISLAHTRAGHIVRAALEDVAVEVSLALSAIGNVVSAPLSLASVSGRCLARSDAFCQLVADLSGLAVARMPMSEAVVVGGALVAVLGASIDPAGLRGPLRDRFQGMLPPGERRRRCQQWAALAEEHSSLGRGGGAGDGRRHGDGRGARQGSWYRRTLSVFVVGAPFALLGFATALLLMSRGRPSLPWRL